jgi:hypothetical protein
MRAARTIKCTFMGVHPWNNIAVPNIFNLINLDDGLYIITFILFFSTGRYLLFFLVVKRGNRRRCGILDNDTGSSIIATER